jgi:hypothetical protein
MHFGGEAIHARNSGMSFFAMLLAVARHGQAGSPKGRPYK